MNSKCMRDVSISRQAWTGMALLLAALLLVSLALTPAPVQAATFTVTSGGDSGSGSLRAAIDSANANPDADTIVFDGVSTVTLTSDQLEITEDLTIDGGDGVTIQRSSEAGTPNFRIFAISGSETEVTLDSLTIENGASSGGGIFNDNGDVRVTGSTISESVQNGIRNENGNVTITDSVIRDNGASITFGGGIFNIGGTVSVTGSTISGNKIVSSGNGGGIANNGGDVTVTDSTISDNEAIDGGGGIANYSGGTATVTNSTISGNEAGSVLASSSGGGIANFSGGEVTVTNSTISGNVATNKGGGIANGLFSNGTIEITNSTISGNEAATGGGGINNDSNGTLTLANTIIANSITSSDIVNDNVLLIQGPTIVADGSVSDPDVIAEDPLLGPLADNGGPTLTHLPQEGSPAINAGVEGALSADTTDLDSDGNTSEPLPRDQRGLERIIGTDVDIGAVEVGAGNVDYRVAINPPRVAEGNSATVTVTRSGTGTLGSSTVTLNIVDGTATLNEDYTVAQQSETLEFAPNDTTAQVIIDILSDTQVEENETLVATLSNPTAPETATISTVAATLTITDSGGDDSNTNDSTLYLPLLQR